ncbi:SDR family oxidoreductase [Paeniglutamicibacter sp. ZC-3]|uniref:SDR family NAD(P)-dependent oxidoreductase n=1 Tax=Paeniglutamicibacter sp. ZC-3 TaxID=2986919 RepID=UPI0021F7BE55|nr:SDR family oxidoreductase [Paeniglutamicibacter sp. ZC-3]MCV9996606.1 SDR family oxidoreductase [Paeniglutamicibacter sp. ZC-3]
MADTSRFDGQAVLVTGASSGIGRATAKVLSQNGARVALIGRDRSRLELAMEELSGSGHETFVVDLDDADNIPSVVQDVASVMGRLSGLVHAAGIHATLPVRSVSAAKIDAMFHTNVTTGFMLSKGFRNKRVRAETASMVFLSSAVGLVGQSGVSTYSATKGAIVTMTKSLALEMASEQIRVNCVCPGVVETPLTEKLRATIGGPAFQSVSDDHPLGLGSAEDVAHAVQFLLSDEASWITGTALSVDGGFTAK